MSFFVLLSTFLTGFYYEYWTDLPLNDRYSDIIVFNQETTIIEKTSSLTNKKLVPSESLLSVNDIYKLYYTYTVKTCENSKLLVTLNKAYFIKNNDKYLDESNLLNFEFDIEKVSSTISKVNISISLNSPQNETEYDMICNSQIAFTLIFKQESI